MHRGLEGAATGRLQSRRGGFDLESAPHSASRPAALPHAALRPSNLPPRDRNLPGEIAPAAAGASGSLCIEQGADGQCGTPYAEQISIAAARAARVARSGGEWRGGGGGGGGAAEAAEAQAAAAAAAVSISPEKWLRSVRDQLLQEGGAAAAGCAAAAGSAAAAGADIAAAIDTADAAAAGGGGGEASRRSARVTRASSAGASGMN